MIISLFPMRLKTLAIPFALLLLAGPAPLSAAPIPPPLITVKSLFSEVLTGMDEQLTAGHWELFGAHALEVWPQGEPADKAAGLLRIAQEDTFLPVHVWTSRPVRLTQEAASLRFFEGVPSRVPRDGSWIGFKYVFYPGAVLESGVGGAGSYPIAFFVVRPAPADLKEADLAPPLTHLEEIRLITEEMSAYKMLWMWQRHDPQSPFAKRLLAMAADYGLVQAQFLDGEHEHRLGTPGALAKARHRYQQAAEQGLAKAQARFALMLYLGEGGAVDLAAARTWYQRAAEHGMADCQAALANMLEFGQGGPSDPVAARVWAQRSADQDFQMGHLILGRMLQDGQGGPVDRVAARAQYQRAVEQGGDLGVEALGALAALPQDQGHKRARDEAHDGAAGPSAPGEPSAKHPRTNPDGLPGSSAGPA